MSTTPEQLATTGRWISAGIWVCAAITMTASIINGTSVFAVLTASAIGVVVGLLTALAVDACLVVVLCGDRRMQDLGLPTTWGRVLRWTTLLMSLAINCGASLMAGHDFLAALHAIPPLLIVGMSEYGQEVGLAFQAAIRRQREAEEAARRIELDRIRAEQAAEAARLREVADRKQAEAAEIRHQLDLAAASERAAQSAVREAEAMERLNGAKRAASETVAAALAKPDLHVLGVDGKPRPRRTVATAKATTTGKRDAALAYIAAQHATGRALEEIGSAEINRAIQSRGYIKGALLAELRELVRQANPEGVAAG